MALLGVVLCAAAASGAPASFDDEFRRGLMALNRNDLAEAQQSLERATKLSPRNARAWVALAQARLRSGQRKPATDAARSAAGVGASDPVVQHALTIFYAEAGDHARAARWEARFASGGKADPDAPARVASLYLQAGDAPQAILWAKKALSAHETTAMHHLLGAAYAAAKRPEATAELRLAAEREPENEGYVFDFGQALLRNHDFAAALTTFEQGRQRFPKSAQIELAYGVALYAQRRFNDAVAAYLRVIRLDGSIEQPYVFLGRILDHVGDQMPAVLSAYAAWEKAAPRNYLPPFLRAKALSISSGDPAEIEAALRRSVRLNGGFADSRLELGALLAKQRKWQEAETELTRSIELNPKNANAHFQLARVYDRLGKPEKARLERAAHERLTAAETSAADSLPVESGNITDVPARNRKVP